MSYDPEAVEAIDQWLAMPQRPDRDTATDLLDYLAAAGYTVHRCLTCKRFHEAFCERATPEPLYRKIEGSTDGADRD